MALTSVLLVPILACSLLPASGVPPSGPTVAPSSAPSECGDDFDWSRKGPAEFLDRLRQSYRPGQALPFYSVHGEHRGWVTEADVPRLLELAASSDPCLAVVSTLSSWLPDRPSTVGHEALYILAGFRAGKYPPELASTRWSGSLEEYRQWWQKHEARSLTRP